MASVNAHPTQMNYVNVNPTPEQLLGGRLKIGDDFAPFRDATVDLSEIFANGSGEFNGAFVNLSEHLEDLMLENDPFIPETIFVRPCMKEVLSAFYDDAKYRRKIVIGAPGVGKSVLAFLGALRIALTGEKDVLFVRKTSQSGEPISVFWFSQVPDSSRVRVVFSRRVPAILKLHNVVPSVLRAIYGLSYTESASKYRVCVDGPHHTDKDDISSEWDLITSGGHPTLKSEQFSNTQILIVNSWSDHEVCRCLRMLRKIKKRDAETVYDLLGGSIRDAMAVTKGSIIDAETLENFKESFDKVMQSVDREAIDLVTEFTTRSSDRNSVDRLRAMYAKQGRLSNSYQIVQSPYILRALREYKSFESMRGDLAKAQSTGNRTLYGCYFELFGHKMMHELSTKRSANQEAMSLLSQCVTFETVTGMGGWKQSSKALNRELLYWQPEKDNFPNIDAAILIQSTLHCIQYFVSKDGFHLFNYRTFELHFLKELSKDLHIEEVVVHFVTPAEVDFQGVKLPASQKKACESMIRATCEIKWYSKNSSLQASTSKTPDSFRELPKRRAIAHVENPSKAHAPGMAGQDEIDIIGESGVDPMETDESSISDDDEFDEDYLPETQAIRAGRSCTLKESANWVPTKAIEFRHAKLSREISFETEIPFSFLKSSSETA